jgi:hypothetical protein
MPPPAPKIGSVSPDLQTQHVVRALKSGQRVAQHDARLHGRQQFGDVLEQTVLRPRSLSSRAGIGSSDGVQRDADSRRVASYRAAL